MHNSAQLQKQLLQAEGVEVHDDYTLDIGHYRYRAVPADLAQLPLEPEYMDRISAKYVR